jgi:RNA polymerase sigma-70 factor (ECF subfamily)
MIDYKAETDASLIALGQADPDAFRALYDRYAARLHRFFVGRGAGSDAAVDLVAETFAQAWCSRRRFRDLAHGSAAPWLFLIAKRVLMASVKKGRIERSLRDRLRVEWQESDESPISEWLDGLDASLVAALAELPPQYRRAVQLRVVEGLSYSALACELRCTETAARIRVSRALARMRTQLEGSN